MAVYMELLDWTTRQIESCKLAAARESRLRLLERGSATALAEEKMAEPLKQETGYFTAGQLSMVWEPSKSDVLKRTSQTAATSNIARCEYGISQTIGCRFYQYYVGKGIAG